MKIEDRVKRKLQDLPTPSVATNQAALDEAERLADLFSNVKVVPYRVPTERFIGMSFVVIDENELFA